MKNLFLFLFTTTITLLLFSSCGEKFTPMSAEDMQTTVDSLYSVKKAEVMSAFAAKCDSSLVDAVSAKVQELTTNQ